MSGSSQEPASGVGAVLAAEADWGLETRAGAHGWEVFGWVLEARVLVKAAGLPACQRAVIK
ncbi:MAG TPA: hypothetical protein VGC99_25675 [Candidatus Tectomicrobia bacterium]